ncbi:MAG: cell division protein SepF [Clostridia bacterium]|nr:cell division protein SepF [Clostridia bacterium]MBR4761591.1 cell division protein SepF [Clostridia bacterium]
MGFGSWIKNIMTIPEDEEIENGTAIEEENEPKFEKEEPVKREPRIIKSKAAPQPSQHVQVVLVKPDRFDDMPSVADHLNAGKTVVLNLEDASSEVARRMVDFLSGVTYANGGNMKKVAKNTFLIAAHGVGVAGEVSLDDFDESKIYF